MMRIFARRRCHAHAQAVQGVVLPILCTRGTRLQSRIRTGPTSSSEETPGSSAETSVAGTDDTVSDASTSSLRRNSVE